MAACAQEMRILARDTLAQSETLFHMFKHRKTGPQAAALWAAYNAVWARSKEYERQAIECETLAAKHSTAPERAAVAAMVL